MKTDVWKTIFGGGGTTFVYQNTSPRLFQDLLVWSHQRGSICSEQQILKVVNLANKLVDAITSKIYTKTIQNGSVQDGVSIDCKLP